MQHGNGSGRYCRRTGAVGAPETRRPFVPQVGYGEGIAWTRPSITQLWPAFCAPCIAKGGCPPFKNRGYPRIVLCGRTTDPTRRLSTNPYEPFTIDVPDATIRRILERVRLYEWTEAPEGGGWAYGTNLDYMKELVAYV